MLGLGIIIIIFIFLLIIYLIFLSCRGNTILDIYNNVK